MPQETDGTWSPIRLVGFRLLLSYLVLYNIPQQGSASLFDILPWGNGPLNTWLAKPMQPLALWLGIHVFHLKGIAATFHPTGSGDTALNYVLVFICVCLALLATAAWSILDRRRSQYRTLQAWLRLIVSFIVAAALVEYGFAKIFPSQFGPISIIRLNETYGESSPMALLWTFMSGSRWYTMFGGLAEVIPGFLLFFRRTRTLGALLGSGVLLNVVLLNFCYDVPVKIYSTHLLLMCVYLAWPDLRALFRLFVLRGQAQLQTDHVPASERLWLRRAGYVLPAVLLVCALVSVGLGAYQPYPLPPDTHAPLYGRWHVDQATATTQQVPWSDIYIDPARSLLIKRVDGTYIRLNMKLDAPQKAIAITSKKFGDSTLHYKLDPADPLSAVLDGPFNKGEVHLRLSRRSPAEYSLLTRGFHWVNEDSPNW